MVHLSVGLGAPPPADGATAEVELSCDTGGKGLLTATFDCASVVLDTWRDPELRRPLVPSFKFKGNF